MSQIDAEFNANLRENTWSYGSAVGGKTTQSSLYSGAFSDSSLTSVNGWKAAKNSSQERVGTTFTKPVTIHGIRVSKPSSNEFISEFEVQYSLDKKNFIDIGTTFNCEDLINRDMMTFKFPVAISKVFEARIVPKKAVKWYALKFEFVVSSDDVATKDIKVSGNGMGLGTVPKIVGGMGGMVNGQTAGGNSNGVSGKPLLIAPAPTKMTGSMGSPASISPIQAPLNGMGGAIQGGSQGPMGGSVANSWTDKEQYSMSEFAFLKARGEEMKKDGSKPFSSQFSAQPGKKFRSIRLLNSKDETDTTNSSVEFYVSSSNNNSGNSFKCEEKCVPLKFNNGIFTFSSPIDAKFLKITMISKSAPAQRFGFDFV